MQQKLFDVLFKDEDVTWKSMIYDLVKSEKMNPWDIDISYLAQQFLEMLKKMKELNFRVSGKIIMAAAILLRIKSNKLINEDLSELDNLIASSQDIEDEFYEELDGIEYVDEEFQGYAQPRRKNDENYSLIPKTPQPRKRKVSVYDLVDALQKALEVKKRRTKRFLERQESLVEAPKNVVDITEEIDRVYSQVSSYFKTNQSHQKVKFSDLLSSEDKMEKIFTFVPLLHLTNQRKVNLEQEKHLDEIYVQLEKKKEAETKE